MTPFCSYVPLEERPELQNTSNETWSHQQRDCENRDNRAREMEEQEEEWLGENKALIKELRTDELERAKLQREWEESKA